MSTPNLFASSTVQTVSPDALPINPVSPSNLGSLCKTSSVRSIIKPETKVFFLYKLAIFSRSKPHEDFSKTSKPPPFDCIYQYSIALCPVFEKCPAPLPQKYSCPPLG